MRTVGRTKPVKAAPVEKVKKPPKKPPNGKKEE